MSRQETAKRIVDKVMRKSEEDYEAVALLLTEDQDLKVITRVLEMLMIESTEASLLKAISEETEDTRSVQIRERKANNSIEALLKKYFSEQELEIRNRLAEIRERMYSRVLAVQVESLRITAKEYSETREIFEILEYKVGVVKRLRKSFPAKGGE